jgi:GTPase SAR1 family protein
MTNIIDYEAIMKIIIVGESGVGKTNILNRYINDLFSQQIASTIGVELSIKKY